MYMLLKDGKTKVLTLSYDDGVVQDIRLIKIMNEHGLKGTFNVNSAMYRAEDSVREKFYGRMKLSEAKELYLNSGQEVAVHALTHPFLDKLDTAEIIYEITEDKKAIERDYGRIARGMASPYGTYNDKVVDILEKCHIAYARTVKSTYGFGFPENWLTLHPTCHHNDEKLDELIKKDSRYGKIVCRCENVSEGEIIDAIQCEIDVDCRVCVAVYIGAKYAFCDISCCAFEIMAQSCDCC